MTRARLTFTTLLLPVLLLAVVTKDARATSFSQSVITGSIPAESNGDTSSSVVQGGNSASSFLNPVAETMGGSVASDGSAFSVSTLSEHSDDWCFPAVCGIADPIVHVVMSASFDGTIDAGLAASGGEFNILAQYFVGGDLFEFSAFEDDTPLNVEADFNGNPAAVSVTTDASGNVHLSTTVVAPLVFFVPTSCVDCPLFSDNQKIQLEMEGTGFVDASHTFTVTLTPLDPGTVLNSTDGRTAGTAPSAEPVPEPASLLLLGTGLIPLSRRLRRR